MEINNKLTPMERYEYDLSLGKVQPDPFQQAAVADLQVVFDAMLSYWERRPTVWNRLWVKIVRGPEVPVMGVYFWGGVGRGKTYVMDLFFQCLPGTRKKRIHFHSFMQMVHVGLREASGESDPLDIVAMKVSKEVDIVCFDEFFVSDIGDAMILGGVLAGLFDRGVTLVATSNIPPMRLYENGLQREKFLPSIALLEKHTKIVHLDGGCDYRLRSLEQAEIFHDSTGVKAEQGLLACFNDLVGKQTVKKGCQLKVLGREVLVRYWSEGVVWFSFAALCAGPRSAADYIEIAQLFHTLVLSEIPLLSSENDDQARRFISLIDELYTHNVALVASAEASIEMLYTGDDLAFVFERTKSRLLEMQSHEYLAREHLP